MSPAAPERFQETLRPEAKRMKWRDLCPPTRIAVHDLLRRLYTGVKEVVDLGQDRLQKRTTEEHRISTAFLVTGPRGSGKTTVMLSAAYATETRDSQDEFLLGARPRRRRRTAKDSEPLAGATSAVPRENGNHARGPEGKFARRREAARLDAVEESLNDRRYGLVDSIHWLEPLDMEILPKGGNLLTSLLVRVRDAVMDKTVIEGGTAPAEQRSDRAGAMSLLEEGGDLNRAWNQLDGLLSKATLMWEGSAPDGDARRRLPALIDAAETATQFQDRVRKALYEATTELGRRRGNESLVLVLPIDNADRDAHRVSELLKLVRMIYCPTLWFVIAGTDADLAAYLESSYRRELASDLSVTRSPAARRDLDKLLVSARRISASTIAAALPPTHRVDLSVVAAREALMFRIGKTGRLYERLRALTVDWQSDAIPSDREALESDPLVPHSLLDLIAPVVPERRERQEGIIPTIISRDVSAVLDKKWAREGAESGRHPGWLLSQAGRDALTQPVRCLVDLWQAAGRHGEEVVAYDGSVKAGEAAVELATEMFRRAASEGELPGWAYSYLRDEVIHRDEVGRVCLDFRRNPIRWVPKFSVSHVIDFPDSGNSGDIAYSRLALHDFHGYAVEIWKPDGTGSADLDPYAAGWLMLLHDLLTRRPGPRIVVSTGTRRVDENPVLVQTQHRAFLLGGECQEIKMTWTMPAFETFFDFARMRLQWQAFVETLLPFEEGKERAVRLPEWLFQRALTAWIDCVLSIALPASKVPWALPGGTEEPWDGYGRRVSERLLTAFQKTRQRGFGRTSGRSDAVRQWLETGVPLMQMPEYLPGVPSPDIPGQFKGAFEEDYKKRLRERRRYLAWKREEHVGAAIEGTDAYRERAAMLVRGRGAERELRAEMLAARKSWFGAARGLAPGNEWANTFDPWPSLMTRSAETQRVATEHRPPH